MNTTAKIHHLAAATLTAGIATVALSAPSEAIPPPPEPGSWSAPHEVNHAKISAHTSGDGEATDTAATSELVPTSDPSASPDLAVAAGGALVGGAIVGSVMLLRRRTRDPQVT